MGSVTSARAKVFFDGGCRPNPGAMETAVVTGGRSHIRRDIGHGNSIDAEWAALIRALEVAIGAGLADFVILGDARAVIDQAGGRTRARGANARHLAAFRALAAQAPPFGLRHVKRAQNLAGIALARAHAR